MQGRIQETLDQVGSSTRTQIENMRQAWERVASVENGPHTGQSLAFQPQTFGEKPNPELEQRAHKVSDRLSENIHIIANEPSLAFYRIQEHVRKTTPHLVNKKVEVQSLHKKIQGSCFDTEYAINALHSMTKSGEHFTNIQDLLKNAVFMKQQIQYEQSRRNQNKPSMYRGSMTRTQTVDTTMSLSSRGGRSAEFTQSVQLPSTTSLDQIEASRRGRSPSVDSSRTKSETRDDNNKANTNR